MPKYCLRHGAITPSPNLISCHLKSMRHFNSKFRDNSLIQLRILGSYSVISGKTFFNCGAVDRIQS